MVGEVTPLAPASLTHPLIFLTPEEPDHTSSSIDAGGPKRLKFRDGCSVVVPPLYRLKDKNNPFK